MRMLGETASADSPLPPLLPLPPGILKRTKSMPNMTGRLECLRSKSISFCADLEKVCVFEITSSPKTLPTSTVYSVQDTGDLDAGSLSQTRARSRSWVICQRNAQHVASGTQMVHIDKCSVDTEGQHLTISILVRNLAYEKSVNVVYTSDGWATSVQRAAQFVGTITPTHGDFVGIDRFLFKVGECAI
jgi:hypothetical protein